MDHHSIVSAILFHAFSSRSTFCELLSLTSTFSVLPVSLLKGVSNKIILFYVLPYCSTGFSFCTTMAGFSLGVSEKNIGVHWEIHVRSWQRFVNQTKHMVQAISAAQIDAPVYSTCKVVLLLFFTYIGECHTPEYSQLYVVGYSSRWALIWVFKPNFGRYSPIMQISARRTASQQYANFTPRCSDITRSSSGRTQFLLSHKWFDWCLEGEAVVSVIPMLHSFFFI